MPGLTHIEPEPTEETRYGIYIYDGKQPRRIAETDRDGIGTALDTLSQEIEGTPVFGVLDRITRRWLSGMWQGGR